MGVACIAAAFAAPEAEAEADPAYLTYGYPAYGYRSAYNFPAYNGYNHAAVPAVHSAYVAPTYYPHALNNVHYLGKRSAEAEADPAYPVYSGYTPYAAYTPYFGANYYGGYRAYNRFW